MAAPEKYLLRGQLIQGREEDCEVSELEPRIEGALAGRNAQDAESVALYEALEALVVSADFPYDERPTLEGEFNTPIGDFAVTGTRKPKPTDQERSGDQRI